LILFEHLMRALAGIVAAIRAVSREVAMVVIGEPAEESTGE
jgi:hypothetical protein